MSGTLAGVRIIDLSWAAAGPFGTMLLGDLGAEVIKIETPEGEITRKHAGPRHRGENWHFLGLNRNKKSVVLDLGTETGKEAIYDLVKISDVVLTNMRPEAVQRLGLDYETIKMINRRIISCLITGFGSSGPYADRRCFDPTAQGISGFMSLVREPGGLPLRPSPPVGDYAAGLFATVGIVAALLERESTGVGQRVEVPVLDACVSLVADYFTYYSITGVAPEPVGSGAHHTVPTRTYPTREGYLTLTYCWPRIARVLGAEWLIDDPRFADAESRLRHREELDAILIELFSEREAKDWLEVLYAEDIAASPVNTVDEAAEDPQILHNKMIVSLKHPLGGEIKVAGNPVRMHARPQEEYLPPPTLGQHTEEVLGNLLGYSEERIARLKKEQEEHAAELAARLLKER